MYLAGVPLPSSMLRQAIHFAPGAIPIWLVPPSSPIAVPVVWLPWKEIIARLLRIVPAGIAHAVVNGIMPVKVMVRVCSVPTSIMRLERVMRPSNTGICAGNHDSLPFKPERPDIRRMRVNDSRLDRRRRARPARSQRRLVDRAWLRKIVVNLADCPRRARRPPEQPARPRSRE